MREKKRKPTNTSLWPSAPSTFGRCGMLREHNVFNITFFQPRALAKIFLCLLLSLYTFGIKCNKIIESKKRKP